MNDRRPGKQTPPTRKPAAPDEARTPSARHAAMKSLIRCEADQRYSNLEIDASIKKNRLEGAERALYTTLVYGVIERRLTLDYLIARLSAKPADQLDAEVLTALRLGLYQLIYLDRIPDSAAVNESVELVKAVKPRAASFVNAILRGYLRSYGKGTAKLPYPKTSDRLSDLSVRYSCSPDVIALLARSCGTDVLTGEAIEAIETGEAGETIEIESLLAAFETPPGTSLRVNTLRTSRDAVLARLRSEGIAADPMERVPFGIRLGDNHLPDAVSELIRAGIVYIQDEASQLALLAANPKPGEIVIDACACPGGKSHSAAILMENTGVVRSFDLHENKLSLIVSGAERLGITIISASERDGSVYDETLRESADLVLCDVPCSGLGVIAKKPELRYKRREDIDRLPDIQYQILATNANYAKPGARVFYTTCTLNRAENEEVAARFLAEHPAFTPCDFEAGGLRSTQGMLTLWPHRQGTDGFFISSFQKKKADQ